MLRLHQVSYAFKAHKETGRAVRANKLAEIPGFAPTTFHALGARVAAQHPPRSYNMLDHQRARVRSSRCTPRARGCWPAIRSCRLVPGHALAIGATSYDGKIFYGIDADRDAVPDVDVLGQCLVEALDELVDASSATRARAPRGRVPRKKGDDLMRVYLPEHAGGAARCSADGGRRSPATVGYAATAGLPGELGGLGDEETEFALTSAAAEASLELLGDGGADARPPGRGRGRGRRRLRGRASRRARRGDGLPARCDCRRSMPSWWTPPMSMSPSAATTIWVGTRRRSSASLLA